MARKGRCGSGAVELEAAHPGASYELAGSRFAGVVEVAASRSMLETSVTAPHRWWPPGGILDT
jgi:hypothetical protein